nr:tRNA guanosine 2' O methyltransferase TRM11 [Hymenolepis microstoma]
MDYLLAFAAHDFINFRELEIRSLLTIHGLSQDCIPSNTNWTDPYVKASLPNNEVASAFIERSMLVKSIYLIWACAPSFEQLLEMVPRIPRSSIEKYLYENESYKIVVSSVNKRIPFDHRLPYIQSLVESHVEISAPVDLDNPKHKLHIIFEYAKPTNNKGDQALLRVYYGLAIAESCRKQILNQFDLSKRFYLGNTTMDVCLAGIIANAALCKRGDIVWDPFIGTGGMVLAASIWGAYGAGNDIDYSLVHGIGASPKAGKGKRTKGECLRANYRQYGMESRYLDVLIADAASLGRLLRTLPPNEGMFDAMITDPPYGVRERSCRVASEAAEKEPSLQSPEFIHQITGEKQFALVPDQNGLVPVPHDLPHYPHKEDYPLQETFGDLLLQANIFLKPGGRLVFWVPVSKSNYKGPSSLPAHPRFKLITVCEQALNLRISRFLMVMEKLRPNEPDFSLATEVLNEAIDDEGRMSNNEVRGIPFHLKNFRETYFLPKDQR